MQKTDIIDKNNPSSIVVGGGGNYLDLIKFILSLLIVALHTYIFPELFWPLLRVAVPLFFILSSYFFFYKIKEMALQDKKNALKKFICRNLELYLFWTVFFLPILIPKWYRYCSSSDILYSLGHFIKWFLFSGTFPASWFIPALIIGVSLVTLLSTKLSDKVLILIGFIFYIICCADSNYFHLFFQDELSSTIIRRISNIICPRYSFPAGILWIVIGKVLIERHFAFNNKVISAILAFSILSLFVEDWLIHRYSWMLDDNPYYFSLIPLCICLFVLFTRLPKKNSIELLCLRKSSVIVYCTHLSVIQILASHTCLDKYLIFFITCVLCFTISSIILFLERYKSFSWLKFAH